MAVLMHSFSPFGVRYIAFVLLNKIGNKLSAQPLGIIIIQQMLITYNSVINDKS